LNPLREVYEAEAAVARRAVPMRTLGHFHLDEDARQLVLYQLAANDFSVIGWRSDGLAVARITSQLAQTRSAATTSRLGSNRCAMPSSNGSMVT
jgi:hypothetical protein